MAASCFKKDQREVLDVVIEAQNVLPRSIIHTWISDDLADEYQTRIRRFEPVPRGLFHGQMRGYMVGAAAEQVARDVPREWKAEPQAALVGPPDCFRDNLLSGMAQKTFKYLTNLTSVVEFVDFLIQAADTSCPENE